MLCILSSNAKAFTNDHQSIQYIDLIFKNIRGNFDNRVEKSNKNGSKIKLSTQF